MKNIEQSPYDAQTSAIQEGYYDDEISLFEILSVIWKRKFFIILSVFICTVIAGVYLIFNNNSTYKTQALISLNFPGIENHVNPDKSTFNKDQIMNPSVLSKVKFPDNIANTAGFKSKRSMLSVEESIPENILAEMKKNPAKTYLTNIFSLSLITDETIPFSKSERSGILLSVVEEYKEEFLNKYMQDVNLAENIPDNFLKFNDYIEVIDILKIRFDNVLEFLNKKIETTSNFHSSTNNRSFSDLQADLEILKNVELARIHDVVVNLNLTKDKNILIIKLKQKIKSLAAEIEKESGRASIAQELLEKIALSSVKGSSDVSFPSGMALETEFIEKLRKEDNLSYLIKTILAAKSNANDLLIEQKQTSEILKGLEQGTAIKENNKNVEYVESSIESLISKYKLLADETNSINRAFLNIKFANAIKIEQTPVTLVIKEKKASLIIALVGIASLFISVFSIFLIEYIINANKEKQNFESANDLNPKRNKTKEPGKGNNRKVA